MYNKILVIISFSILMILYSLNLYAAPTNTLKEPTYIIKVSSKHPQQVTGSYLALSCAGSSLINIEQQTPLEIRIKAQTINAIFHTKSTNDFLQVELLREQNHHKKILVGEKGHGLIVHAHTADQQAFIVAR